MENITNYPGIACLIELELILLAEYDFRYDKNSRVYS